MIRKVTSIIETIFTLNNACDSAMTKNIICIKRSVIIVYFKQRVLINVWNYRGNCTIQ